MELTILILNITRHLWLDIILVIKNITILKCHLYHCIEKLAECSFLPRIVHIVARVLMLQTTSEDITSAIISIPWQGGQVAQCWKESSKVQRVTNLTSVGKQQAHRPKLNSLLQLQPALPSISHKLLPSRHTSKHWHFKIIPKTSTW